MSGDETGAGRGRKSTLPSWMSETAREQLLQTGEQSSAASSSDALSGRAGGLLSDGPVLPAPKRLAGAVFNAPGEGKKSRTQGIKAQLVLKEQELQAGDDKVRSFKERNIFSICELLIGARIVVELKNETQIQGTVELTVPNSNDIFLQDVEETSGFDKSVKYFKSMLVRGNTIRYMQIPPEINVVNRLTTIENLREKSKQRSMNILSGFNDGSIRDEKIEN